MKKNYTYFLLLFLFFLATSNEISAQIRGHIVYEETLKYNMGQLFESLYVTHNLSIFLSKKTSSTLDTSIKVIADHNYLKNEILPIDSNSFLVRVDLEKNEMLRIGNAKMLSKKREIYRDSIYNFDWQIIPDSSKIILGFTCSKAKAFFRGRNYEAWFTEEIPLPFGPNFIHGAPGIILEVNSDGNFSKYKAVSIDFKTDFTDQVFEIKNRSRYGEVLSRQAYRKLAASEYEKWEAAMSIPQKNKHGTMYYKVDSEAPELY